jgi:molybdopterin synthase catalytic subunit
MIDHVMSFNQPSASVAASLELPEGVCVLTYDTLNVEQIRCSVASDGAGATVVFVGTTRNSFKGIIIVDTEYIAGF